MSTVRKVPVGVILVGVLLTITGCGGGDSSGAASGPSGASGGTGGEIERVILAETEPANAPGQTLYLQEVTIAPGAELPQHFHQGTQVAAVRSGVLTYDIVSGTAAVTRKGGGTEQIAGPRIITLEPGDSLTETRDLVHYGSNQGDEPVVITVAALLRDGAPLATPSP